MRTKIRKRAILFVCFCILCLHWNHWKCTSDFNVWCVKISFSVLHCFFVVNHLIWSMMSSPWSLWQQPVFAWTCRFNGRKLNLLSLNFYLFIFERKVWMWCLSASRSRTISCWLFNSWLINRWHLSISKDAHLNTVCIVVAGTLVSLRVMLCTYSRSPLSTRCLFWRDLRSFMIVSYCTLKNKTAECGEKHRHVFASKHLLC